MNWVAPRSSVLLAEDDENDIVLVRQGLALAGLDLRLLVARDGQEAVDYLSGGALLGQADVPPRPDLVLLDITMPRLSGFEVLRWLRSRPEFATLPVVMLSYSILDSDRRTARLLGVSEFRVKTRTVEGTAAMLQEVYAQYLGLKAMGGAEPVGEARAAARSKAA